MALTGSLEGLALQPLLLVLPILPEPLTCRALAVLMAEQRIVPSSAHKLTDANAAAGSLHFACTLVDHCQTLLDADEQQLHCLHPAGGSRALPLTGTAVSTLQPHAASASRAHHRRRAEGTRHDRSAGSQAR